MSEKRPPDVHLAAKAVLDLTDWVIALVGGPKALVGKLCDAGSVVHRRLEPVYEMEYGIVPTPALGPGMADTKRLMMPPFLNGGIERIPLPPGCVVIRLNELTLGEQDEYREAIELGAVNKRRLREASSGIAAPDKPRIVMPH